VVSASLTLPAVHTCAHLFNVHHLVEANGAYPKVKQGETDENVAFTTIPGLTGVIITLSLILMVTTAVEQIRLVISMRLPFSYVPCRRSYFELFWYTHHLFIVYYIGMAIHGLDGFVQHQDNPKEVPFFEYKKTLNGRCDSRQLGSNDPGCTRLSLLSLFAMG
jgi:NADPH oxidase